MVIWIERTNNRFRVGDRSSIVFREMKWTGVYLALPNASVLTSTIPSPGRALSLALTSPGELVLLGLAILRALKGYTDQSEGAKMPLLSGKRLNLSF